MSGDSWVRATCLKGLANHKNLKILHLGHLEHGDTNCDANLNEYPPEGIFIKSLFEDPELFPSLNRIYLE